MSKVLSTNGCGQSSSNSNSGSNSDSIKPIPNSLKKRPKDSDDGQPQMYLRCRYYPELDLKKDDEEDDYGLG